MRIPLTEAITLGSYIISKLRFGKSKEQKKLAILTLLPLFELAAQQWQDGAREALELAASTDGRLGEFRATLESIYRTLKQLSHKP